MDELSALAGSIGTTGLAISLIFSLLTCFLGYKLLKVWIALAGFFIGLLLGAGAGVLFHVESAGIVLLIGLAAGVVLALLSFKVYKAGVFLLCALSVFLLVSSLLLPDNWWQTAAAIAAGIAVGALSVFAVKPVVVLSTGISGGINAASAGGALFGFAAGFPIVVTILSLVLAVAGVAVQFITNRKSGPEPQGTK